MNPFLSFLFTIYNLIQYWSLSQIWQIVLLYIWFYFPTSIISFHQRYCHCGHDDIEDIGCFPAVLFACFGFPWIIFISVMSTLKAIFPCARETTNQNSNTTMSCMKWFYTSNTKDYYALKSPYLQFLYFLCLPLTFVLQTASNDLFIEQEIPIGANSGTYSDSIAYHASDPFVLAVYSWIFVLPINSYHIVINGMHAESLYDCINLSFCIVFLLFGIASLFTKQFVGVMMQTFDTKEGEMIQIY
jgi:hypothetical protein